MKLQGVRAWIAVGVVLLGRSVAADQELTLSQAMEAALDGPVVRAAEAQVGAAGARVAQAQARRLPQVAATAEATVLREDPGFVIPRGALGNPIPLSLVAGEQGHERAAVGVEQLLLDFGRTGAALAAARANQEAARADFAALRQQVALATVRAFAATLAAHQQVTVLEEAVATAAETERVVDAMVREGLLARSDLLAAQYRRAEVEAQLAGARSTLAAAAAQLAALTGVADPRPASIPLAEEGGDLSGPGGRRAEVDAVAARRRAVEAVARVERAEQLPLFALAAGAEKRWDRYLLHENNAYAAVVLRTSLFDGGSAAARAAEARAGARALAAQEEALRRQIAAELAAAEAAEEAARQRLASSQRGAVAAAEALRLERLRHAQGLATTRELLQAQTEATSARAAVVAARAAVLAAVAERLHAAGVDLASAFADR